MESPRFFLVSYDPLVSSKAGREASSQHKLLPFIDGSIRREPDLELGFPSLSCLCRADKFVPRLRKGDFVAYMTNKGSFGSDEIRRRITAILQVHIIFESHAAAARWYRSHDRRLPTNCCVPRNAPKPLDQTHRRSGVNKTLRQWDAIYQKRAEKYRDFVACKRIWRDLSDCAPKVLDHDLVQWICFKPGETQNPRPRPVNDLKRLMRRLGIPVPPSVR
jgi:hypothetical protein